MARNKAVHTATVTVDDMDRITERGVMGGTQTLHEMLDKT